MEKNLFEVATREGYRFPFKGEISVEDLWKLSLTNLDSVYKNLNREYKAIEEDSLLNTKTAEDTKLSNQIEIVKYIVNVKREEADNRKKAVERKEKKEKIMSIIQEKKEESLRNMPVEELEKLLSEE